MIALITAVAACLSWSFNFCNGIAIDNGVQNVDLDCSETQISLSAITLKPLFQPARIFVKGKSQDRNCMIQYPADRVSQRLVFQLPLSSCGMERAGRQGALQGATFMVTYVVSFHPVFITKVDRAYRLICRYGGGNMDLTAGLSVSMIPTQPLEGFIGMADCTYTVHKGASTSPPVRYANVGDKIYHVWQCRNLKPSQYMWVHDCYVSPEFGNGELIIDSNGCTRDPVVIGQLDYGRQPFHYVVGSHHAYKFADYPTLLWRCSISVCDSSNPSNCRLPNGQTARVPPLCGRARFARDSSSKELIQMHILSENELHINSTGPRPDSYGAPVFDVFTDPLQMLNPGDKVVIPSGLLSSDTDETEFEPNNFDGITMEDLDRVSQMVCMSQVSFALLVCSTGLLLLVVIVCAYIYFMLSRRMSWSKELLG